MAAWPAGLPQQFNGQGYREQISPATIRTPMDVGPDKVRLRSTAAPRQVAGQMRITEAQIATLDTFFKTTTNGGADKFDFPYRTGTQEARFLTPPSYSFVAVDQWDASINLEVFV